LWMSEQEDSQWFARKHRVAQLLLLVGFESVGNFEYS
jgi:hypothetical protein